jgi:hypothetical protein
MGQVFEKISVLEMPKFKEIQRKEKYFKNSYYMLRGLESTEPTNETEFFIAEIS